MSMPIIRLRIVDSNSVTKADDPATASCTLYTFIRSIPSDVECAMSFDDFRHSVQAGRSPSYFSHGNARLLSLIDATVTDRLFRHPPKVVPALARASSTWREFLLGDAGAAQAAQSVQEPQSSTATAPAEFVHETVPAASMQSFQSPYEAPPRRGTHPLLLEALGRLRAAAPAVENDDDRREREFATLMESRAAALRTRLQSAIADVPPEEVECVRFIQHLQLRVDAAERLFAVQRYEEETIQTAEGVLRLEIATMRALLRKIADAIEETEERHKRDGPGAPFYAEECHLIAAFHTAMDDLSS